MTPEVAGGRLVKSLAVNLADDPHLLSGTSVLAISKFPAMNRSCPLQEVLSRLMLIMPGTLRTPGSFAVLVVRDAKRTMAFADGPNPSFVVDERSWVIPVEITGDLAQFFDLLFGWTGPTWGATLRHFPCKMT